jgi:hypothetical protein
VGKLQTRGSKAYGKEEHMRTARLVRVGTVGAGLALLLASWPIAPAVRAGEARLIEEAGPGRVVVEASDATVDEVLAALARRFEFAVERSAPANLPVRFTGRLQGSLDDLLAHVLRHEGHMIVRSTEARAGVSRIVLIAGAAGGAPAPVLAGPIAAIKAKLRERQEAPK